MKQEQLNITDNSKKRILARTCDPIASFQFSKVVKPLIGNAEYVPSTDDSDFIMKLESQKWSVVFFAPGACRFSRASKSIPGGNYDTKDWTLEKYRALVRKLQGEEIQIVETFDERETVGLLNEALAQTREIN